MSIAFGFVLVLLWPFDLLPYSLGSCFGIDFGLLFRFGFHSVFSFGFGLCLVLFVVFGFCFDFNWFRFRFRAGSFTVPLFGFSVPFSNVLILVCFVFHSGYVPHRNPRGRREKVAGLSSVPEHRAQGS